MNRRGFFSLLAAAVVAPGALWAMVKRPKRTVLITGGMTDELKTAFAEASDGMMVQTFPTFTYQGHVYQPVRMDV